MSFFGTSEAKDGEGAIETPIESSTSSAKFPFTIGTAPHETLNLGPLTTAFNYPESCSSISSRTVFFSHTTSLAFAWGAECRRFSDPAVCYPPYLGQAIHAIGHTTRSTPVYSPGTVCPTGWTAAKAISKDGRKGDNELAWSSLGDGETWVYFCPK